jgi:hypothetical protein
MTREAKVAAENVVYAYEHCSDCGACPLGDISVTGGYRCGYLYDKAVKALGKDSKEAQR